MAENDFSPLTLQSKADEDRLIKTGKLNDELRGLQIFGGRATGESALSSFFYGHDLLNMGFQLPQNTDQYGLVFITRPRLNLSYDNIRGIRTFTPMMNKFRTSTAAAVQCLLDPVFARGPLSSPIMNPFNPFITILDNSITALTGWPDPNIETYTSSKGVYGQEWSMADGVWSIYGTYDLNATFKNVRGDPIGFLFNTWGRYQTAVRLGEVIPYPEALTENEIDYMSRIYRIILDPTKRFVQHIGACGACFPTSSNQGKKFDYDRTKNFNEDLNEISVTFRAIGAIYDDPILIEQFNGVVKLFNPRMRDAVRNEHYVKVQHRYKPLFKCAVYPLINDATAEFEWWVAKEDFQIIMGLTEQYRDV